MKKVKLGELVSIQTGKLDANAAVFGGKYPFFTTAKEISRINEYAYDGEVVLVAGNGDLNVKYYKGKFNAYQRTYILTSNSNVRMKYLYYFLDKYIEVLRYQSIGGVIKYIKLNNLSDAQIPMRSILEQDKIIGILEKLDNEIIIRSKQLSELSNLVKSRFNEMFGDIFDNPQSKLEDHIELNPNKKELLNFNGNVSFLPMSNVSENGKIDLSINRNIDDVRKGFTFFKDNDVIVAKITPCFENGKGAPVFGLLNGVGFGSTEFHVLRPKNTVNTVWLYHVTMLSKFRLEGERKMTGSGGQRRITKDFIYNFKLNIPPLALQNEFADFVAQVDKSQLAIQKSLEELETLKKSLMQEYFG